MRRIADRELLLSFMGLSVFFLAVTIPLLLSREWITVSWAIQALVMLWLADKLNSQFLRQVAFLLYGIVLFRFGFMDLPAQYASRCRGPADVALGDYLRHLLERLVVFGVPIASMAGAYFLLKAPGLAAAWPSTRPTTWPSGCARNGPSGTRSSSPWAWGSCSCTSSSTARWAIFSLPAACRCSRCSGWGCACSCSTSTLPAPAGRSSLFWHSSSRERWSSSCSSTCRSGSWKRPLCMAATTPSWMP